MKTHWLLAGLAAAGLGLTFIANSQEPAPKPFENAPEGQELAEEPDPFDPDQNLPRQVQVQVEFVDMSHEALTKLLFLAKPATSDATDLRKQVQDMVSKNEAKVLETQIAIARTGQKATTESIHEFIYPTEHEPPRMPQPAGQGANAAGASGASNLQFPEIPSYPAAFETRNVGSTLEIEPTVGADNQIVELRFVPELIWHPGNTMWAEAKDSLGNNFKYSMPDFYTIRLNTAFTCISGQYTLAGVVSPKDDKGETDMTRKVMVFVKCDVLVVK